MSSAALGGGKSVEPIGGPEAFEETGESARLSQAAFILSAAAGVAGEAGRIERVKEFPLPSLDRLQIDGPMSLGDAIRPLDVDLREYEQGLVEPIPSDVAAGLARDLKDDPQPETAAALVEASLHSETEVVRTAAAAAALETTGARRDIVEQLESASRSRDPVTRDMARTALGRLHPESEAVAKLAIKRPRIKTRGKASNTAVVTHGTFAARSRWWRPNGLFWTYLNGIVPPLHMHSDSFKWSGAYSVRRRADAAEDLRDWVNAQNLDHPDFFGHSHGATVANLSTQIGTEFDRLVLLSWPVHEEWRPSLANVNRVIDVRVKYDLVIMVDRGKQRLPAGMRRSGKVEEHINGWFKHADTHEPAYWDKHDLPSVL